jgi:hypothetical protein
MIRVAETRADFELNERLGYRPLPPVIVVSGRVS